MSDASSSPPLEFVARHYRTGQRVRVLIEGDTIADVVAADGPSALSDEEEWVAPGFWDIQLNGRWGVSFSDPAVTVSQVAAIVRAQPALGTARLCPTLISAPFDALRHGVATIAEACERSPDVGRMIIGIHLEGPYISEQDGYRGAHPRAAVRDPNWAEFEALQKASGNRIALITLAPERPGAIGFIRRAVAEGVLVALGHTAADGPKILEAVDAGARLSTHLGNGIAATLPRHPNAIWVQAACDRLWASVIGDGHHIDLDVLRVLVRAKTPDRIVLVSDASPLAGLPPGRYGEWAVDPSGKIVVAGTPYLAGSNQGLDTGLNHLIHHAGLSLPEAVATVTAHPARFLGRREPNIEPAQPANLVRFRFRGPNALSPIALLSTCVDGRWWNCPAPNSPPAGLGFPSSEESRG
jgi:N-acetylglucosamine-6-phosphate deacetylase